MMIQLENVLLDANENVKISDFGLSALPQQFRVCLDSNKICTGKFLMQINNYREGCLMSGRRVAAYDLRKSKLRGTRGNGLPMSQ